TGDCGSGQAIRQIYQDGTVLCEDIPPGDITGVAAGSGLTGGGSSGVVTVSVSSGGIATTMLADNAITADKLAAGAVGKSQIVAGAVTSAKIEDRSVSFADFGMNCNSGQMMKWNAVSLAWECADNISHNLSAGPGIVINNGVVSITTGEGIATGSILTVDYLATGSEAGYNNRPARSDHHHDSLYIKPDTNLAIKDVTGNQQDGLRVVGIQGRDVGTSSPSPDKPALRFVGGEWQPASYGFPFSIDVQIVESTSPSDSQGVVTVSCPQDPNTQLVAGGCNCGVGTEIEDSFPPGSDSWYCNCNGSDSDYKAYAICLKTTYGSN
nr:hypothetical protein [Anaerolineae bacterium]